MAPSKFLPPDPRPSKADREHREHRKKLEKEHNFEWMPGLILGLMGVGLLMNVEKDVEKREQRHKEREGSKGQDRDRDHRRHGRDGPRDRRRGEEDRRRSVPRDGRVPDERRRRMSMGDNSAAFRSRGGGGGGGRYDRGDDRDRGRPNADVRRVDDDIAGRRPRSERRQDGPER